MSDNTWKYIQLITGIIIIITLLILGYFQLIQKKIAYVDNSLLISNSQIGIDIQKDLVTKIREFQEEVISRESEISMLKTLQTKDPDNPSINNELSGKIAQYNIYLKEVDKQITAYESSLMTPVYDAINRAVKEYGEKHGYILIHGATDSGNILYGDDKINITDEIITYMNDQNSQ